MLVGVGTWIEWAEYEVSYPLGTAIVGLCGLAMYSALMSNKSINFAVVSVVSGIIPIIYEILNENAPSRRRRWSAFLLIFIIIIQGYLAGNEAIKANVGGKNVLLHDRCCCCRYAHREFGKFQLIVGPLKPTEIGNENAANC